MTFAEIDPTPIWTAGGIVAVLGALGTAGRYLLTWFRDTIKAQQDHEKALADGFKDHESKLADKWAARERESQKETSDVCTKFDATIRDLHTAQAGTSSKTIDTLLAIQREMLNAMLALRQESEKLQTMVSEVRRQVDANGQEVSQMLRLFREPKVERARKVP